MKVKENPLRRQFFGLNWMDCSLRAFAYMFNMDKEGIVFAVRLAKWRHPEDGPTIGECHRIIKILSKLTKKEYTYFPNYQKLTIEKWVKTHRKGHFILNYDEHLGICKYGVFIDDWTPGLWNLEGWWEIKDKYPRKKRDLNDSLANAV